MGLFYWLAPYRREFELSVSVFNRKGRTVLLCATFHPGNGCVTRREILYRGDYVPARYPSVRSPQSPEQRAKKTPQKRRFHSLTRVRAAQLGC